MTLKDQVSVREKKMGNWGVKKRQVVYFKIFFLHIKNLLKYAIDGPEIIKY
jgi:hypothetical protein